MRWLRQKWRSLGKRGQRVVLFVMGGFFVLFLVLCSWIYSAARIPLPDDPRLAQTSFVLYDDGAEIGRLASENRVDVPFDSISPTTRNAVLAAEDKSYYKHGAISVRALMRAAWADVRGGKLTQGGSTITQQYAKNAFLSHERTAARKVREAVVAWKLGRKYSKDTVLGWYMNTVYFGRGCFGIETASRTYFGVASSQLTVEQAAVLAALIRAPESGDPERNPEIAKTRWRNVLKTMAAEGWVERGKADTAVYPKIRPRAEAKASNGLSGPRGYILQLVQEELEANGFPAKELLTGGFRIETTLSHKAQDGAVRAMTEALPDATDPESALVAVQPGTGRIKALYGGRDYVVRQFNNATDGPGRQPGSSFKPYVLAAALRKGISIQNRYDGHSPKEVPGYGKPVNNFGSPPEQFGQIDLVSATAHSVNTIYVPLGLEAGVSNVVGTAHDAGIASDDEPIRQKVTLTKDGSIALGTSDVHPIDMAVGFATFAAEGVRARPFLVSRVIQGKDNVVYKARIERKQALDAGVCADVTFAMQHVVTEGTGRAAALSGRPSAGKTGTTSDNRDAWYVGYTPQLSAAVWLGFDPPKPLVRLHGVRQVTGGTIPARVFKQFMEAALVGEEVIPFPPPAYVGGTKPAPSVTSTASESPTATPTVTVTPPITAEPEPTETDPPPETESPEPTDSPEPTPSATQPAPSSSPEPGATGPP